MRQGKPEGDPGVHVSRIMLHDLVNHLTIALGHSDLLLMETEDGAPQRPALEEIRNACQRAVDMVDTWAARPPLEP